MDARPDRSYARWVAACATAEAIGIGTSAAAARVGDRVAGRGGAEAHWLALGVVVAGGLVEGIALGLLQGRVLGERWPALRRTRFAMVTVLVAGLGWAAASAPSVLGDQGDAGSGPPIALTVLGGWALGLVMGPVLGVAQSFALRGAVTHPSRWVVANAVAWPWAMAVIFTAASSAGAGWPDLALAAYAAAAGAIAGAVLGLVSGAWLGSLDGQPLANRAVLALLPRRRFGLDRRVLGLAVTGRRSGRVLCFPVQYAELGASRVVLPGHPDHKLWWRNLVGDPVPIGVLTGPRWLSATARVLDPADDGYDAALAAYRQRWPHTAPATRQPVVILEGAWSRDVG